MKIIATVAEIGSFRRSALELELDLGQPTISRRVTYWPHRLFVERSTSRRVVEAFVHAHPDFVVSSIDVERGELLSLLTHRDINVMMAAGNGAVSISFRIDVIIPGW